MNPLLYLLGLGFAVVALGGRKSTVVQGVIVDIPDIKLPPPDDFRSGAMPDPAHPSDPNRGRYFGEWSSSRQEGTSTLHSATLLQLAADARGSLAVKVWLTRKGEPDKCTVWGASAQVVDGRIMYPGWSLPTKCGTKHAGILEQLGDAASGVSFPGVDGECFVDIGTPVFEQRGPELGMLLSIGVRDRENEWSSHDCNQEPTYYIDVLWHFSPIPASSGATRS